MLSTKYRPALQELDCIASVELADVLAGIRANDVSSVDRARLAAYLRDELGDSGLLDLAHLQVNGLSLTEARALRRNCQALLRWCER